MNGKMTPWYRSLLILISLLASGSLACATLDWARDVLGRLEPTETPASERFSASVWYVAVDGDDSASCDTPENACQTLDEVLLNRATDEDTIYLGPGTYREAIRSGQMFTLNNLDLTIIGAGREQTILDAGGEGSVLLATGDSRFTLRSLTLQNGTGNAPGSCLSVRGQAEGTLANVLIRSCSNSGIEHLSEGPLLLENVHIEDAQIDPELGPGYGGTGITSSGPLTIRNSQILSSAGVGLGSGGELTLETSLIAGSGLDGIVITGNAVIRDVTVQNNALDPVLGPNHAGIQIYGGRAEIIDSIITENDNGVEVISGGDLLLQDSAVQDHPRTGISISEDSRGTLQGGSVRSNGSFYAGTSLPGGIWNDGELEINGTLITQNLNGGLINYGLVFLENTSIRENAGNLAGLTNYGAADITSSLFAEHQGGEAGVESRGGLTMVNSTVSSNAGHGLMIIGGEGAILRYVTIANNGETGLSAHHGGAVVRVIANSILIDNARNDCLIGGTAVLPTLEGTNLDGDGSCGFGPGGTTTAPGLGPLQDNGGPTLTHALENGSSAVDAAIGDCPAGDQRGAPRPVGTRCDVGAFERGLTTISGTIDPQDLATVTPSPTEQPSQPTVNRDTLCWKGPGPDYDTISSLLVGTVVEILGRGVEGDWWVIDNPRYPGAACWTPGKDIKVDPDFPYPETLFEIPPLPTATPAPLQGCLYQGPNDNQPVCYPINSCPVKFENSLGACTP